MKLFFILLFIISSVFANVSETFKGDEVVINGFPVSARKHWNFRAYATPDFKFCKFMGFTQANRAETIVKKVPPQRMAFFTALLSENAEGIEILDRETKLLESVTCTKD